MYKNILFLVNTDVFDLRSIKYNLEQHKTEVSQLTREYSTETYVVFM